MELPKIKPAWRTDTVVALCQSMRETYDFGALPILADALQDADCDDEKFLTRLRSPLPYAEAAALVACVMSEESAEAAAWLVNFADTQDCPRFEELFNGAIGRHDLNRVDNYNWSKIEWWDSEGYLHFNGSDAHGEIPDEFWDKVQLVSGRIIRERPRHFSCSC